MGHPLGKAPIQTGTVPTPTDMPVLTGTTPTDMQRIIGAQYATSGLLPSGGGIVTGTSSMAYDVTAGAAFMWVSSAAKLGMLVPFEATTVVTDPAPATGTRTDTVYVDGNGAVRVAIGSATAPSGVAISRWTIPAGITATTSASQRLDRDFAIATGASLGRLAHWRDPGGGPAGPGQTTRHQSQFYLPSDRVLRADISAMIKSTNGTGILELQVQIIDKSGTTYSRAMLCPFDADWRTYGASWSFEIPEGTTTLKVGTRLYSGTGNWEMSANQPFATEVNVWDAGVKR